MGYISSSHDGILNKQLSNTSSGACNADIFERHYWWHWWWDILYGAIHYHILCARALYGAAFSIWWHITPLPHYQYWRHAIETLYIRYYHAREYDVCLIDITLRRKINITKALLISIHYWYTIIHYWLLRRWHDNIDMKICAMRVLYDIIIDDIIILIIEQRAREKRYLLQEKDIYIIITLFLLLIDDIYHWWLMMINTINNNINNNIFSSLSLLHYHHIYIIFSFSLISLYYSLFSFNISSCKDTYI